MSKTSHSNVFAKLDVPRKNTCGEVYFILPIETILLSRYLFLGVAAFKEPRRSMKNGHGSVEPKTFYRKTCPGLVVKIINFQNTRSRSTSLILSRRRPTSYRNQSIDLLQINGLVSI